MNSCNLDITQHTIGRAVSKCKSNSCRLVYKLRQNRSSSCRQQNYVSTVMANCFCSAVENALRGRCIEKLCFVDADTKYCIWRGLSTWPYWCFGPQHCSIMKLLLSTNKIYTTMMGASWKHKSYFCLSFEGYTDSILCTYKSCKSFAWFASAVET